MRNFFCDEAIEYANLFGRGRVGKLFLDPCFTDCEPIFRVYVLADEKKGLVPGNFIEVYGELERKRYGWRHRGRWEQDFYALVERRKAEVAAEADRANQKKLAAEEAERQRIAKILDSY